MIETLLLSLVTLTLCRSSFLGAFAYEFNAALAIASFFIFFFGTLIRLRNARPLTPLSGALLSPLILVLLFSWKNHTCRYDVGFFWFALLPCVSAVFGAASAAFAHRFARSLLGAILLGLLPSFLYLVLVGFDLYFRPSLFFFHPALGYYPGPLYDEWIPILPKVLTFRLWTLFFSGALFFFRPCSKLSWVLVGLTLSPLCFRSSLGWNHSREDLRQAMPIERISGPLHLHHAKTTFPQGADAYLASLRFHVEDLAARWQVEDVSRIDIYVYPDAATKYDLTGTRDTAIGHPLQRALHILKEPASSSILPHELAHVVSGAFGPRPFRFPMNQALLEGVATSVEGSRGSLSIHEWAKAMAELGKLPSPRELFQPMGFLSEAPFRAYLAAGSFLQWLTEQFGAIAVKHYYAGHPFETSFGLSLSQASENWRAFLRDVPLFPEALATARLALESKSIFERRCPHDVAEALACKEACTTIPCARSNAERAYGYSAKDPWVALALARELLRSNLPTQARATLTAIEKLDAATPQLRTYVFICLGDTKAIEGYWKEASQFYAQATREKAPESLLRVARAKIALIHDAKTELLRTWILDRLPKNTDFSNVDLAYLSMARNFDDLAILRREVQRLSRRRPTFDEAAILAAAYEQLENFDAAMRSWLLAKPLAKTLGKSDHIERELRRLTFLKNGALDAR